MPSSLRARSSMAASPDLRSSTSAASASLRCFRPALSRDCFFTCCCSVATSRVPPLPNQSRYCSHASSTASSSTSTRSARIDKSESALQRHERIATGVLRGPAPVQLGQLLFDAQQLVVLGDAVGPAQRAGLDLGGGGGHGDVGDGRVLGLAGAM